MTRSLRTPRSSERGAALLVAIVAVAVLAALTVDLAYETQVRLRIAANARDDLRAEALARSAVNVSRLVLAFQNQVDQAMGAMNPPAAASRGSSTNPIPALPRPQIWNLIPVSSALTQSLFGDAGPAASTASPPRAGSGQGDGGAPAFPSLSFGDFEGGFQARIEDEGQKVNAQLDAMDQSGWLGAQVEALLRMFCESRWDTLFDRTDADGQRYSRTDLVIHLRDWVNERDGASALKASFPGGNCSFIVPPVPFEAGFSDKNFAYDRGPDRYRTKNARMDSVEELHLVAGVSDAFMAAFGDQLTVYLSKNAGGLNVNTDDVRQQLLIANLMADPAFRVRLTDPAFIQAFHKALTDARMGGFVTITPAQFAQILQSQQVTLRTDLPLQGSKSPFTDRSTVFRIRALGAAGDVTHETEAIVSFDASLLPPGERQAASAAGAFNMGQLIRWREE